uniref:Ionotropic glutamate receptor C-terminal domain-containing protein n=1 Tax=Timema cristinae TaxID=61476 RepID=A0A7R9GWE6_TIMCR|nr:unnamed protein product [Timema cristinae]
MSGETDESDVDSDSGCDDSVTFRPKETSSSTNYQSKKQKLNFDSADLDDHWQSFVKPFSIHLWLAIVATLVLMPMILALSYITGRRTDFELTEGPHLFNIREAYIVTYGAFLQQSSENDPKSPSARLVFWLAFILGVVLYTAYSAALISKLTVQKTEYPFLTAEEMLRSGYKLNVVRGHYTLTVLQNMAAGPLAQVYRKHLHGNPRALVDDIEAGLMRVSRNSKIAFLDILERTEAILGKRRCSLLAIPTDFIRTHATLVVRKRMPYKKAFDYYLRKMWESGQLERLRIKWWATVKTNCPEEDLTSMDMEQVSAVFMCLLIGILVSLITFILETIHHKLRGDDLS